ncbi:hypothetical protein SLS58_005259 [Diplodia intermedia]|uniref:Uncharacterized protein n=1 Tax=Diplodia intermedia TaxID=856260 RepID=A0ABR3TRB2_9PEZI
MTNHHHHHSRRRHVAAAAAAANDSEEEEMTEQFRAAASGTMELLVRVSSVAAAYAEATLAEWQERERELQQQQEQGQEQGQEQEQEREGAGEEEEGDGEGGDDEGDDDDGEEEDEEEEEDDDDDEEDEEPAASLSTPQSAAATLPVRFSPLGGPDDDVEWSDDGEMLVPWVETTRGEEEDAWTDDEDFYGPRLVTAAAAASARPLEQRPQRRPDCFCPSCRHRARRGGGIRG